MQAKCPDCETGCAACDGGFFEAEIADGALYAHVCAKCGFESGGRVTGPGLPPIEEDLGGSKDCILDCGGERVYRLVAIIKDGVFSPVSE